MAWENIIQFMKPELVVLVVFLWCLGLFLKKAPWFKQEWMIPFILLFASFLITIAYISVVLGEGLNAVVIVSGIIQAVIIAAISVFGNEVFKQLFNKRFEDR